MRKITKEAIEAFEKSKPFYKGNTKVTISSDGVRSLLLFGNEIARYIGKDLWVTTDGWFTSTTQNRLNGFPQVHIHVSKGKWYLNGEIWDGEWIKIK